MWIIPADRMKAKLPHRVPLSEQALSILRYQKQHARHPELVFPAPMGGLLSDMVLTSYLRRVKANSDVPGRVATAHGFRSSFRDWASENGYPRDLAERALAHTINNQTEAAYHRSDLLEQRRPMMNKWADFCFLNVL
ncbi:tyrosine-type recombinase/integrase [Vogesella fluminis]|uniref:tyrosine-type recombinase/integrase n=1 Tax=Vogesella fluminis TaxID=1069161 RepID=UPI00362F94C5